MRVIAGKFKGLQLDYSITKECRPTKDRIKESIFSIIHDDCMDAKCLDLFAGSGSLSFEAISRGAIFVQCVDVEPKILKKNILKFNESLPLHVFKGNAQRFLQQTSMTFDIVFVDPPWTQSQLFFSSLKAIFEFDILNLDGYIICEHPKKVELSDFSVFKQKKYRDTMVSFIKRESV